MLCVWYMCMSVSVCCVVSVCVLYVYMWYVCMSESMCCGVCACVVCTCVVCVVLCI